MILPTGKSLRSISRRLSSSNVSNDCVCESARLISRSLRSREFTTPYFSRQIRAISSECQALELRAGLPDALLFLEKPEKLGKNMGRGSFPRTADRMLQ